MADLFKKKEESKKYSRRKEIMLTEEQYQQIEYSAKIRNLDISEFMRRTALGRKADVKFDQKIVLTLHQLVMAIRDLYEISEGNKTPIPAAELELLRKLINDSGAAILRISK